MVEALFLDRIDLRILKELQRNARVTNQDLAIKACLSPSSCLQRVRRLEKNKILLSYHARVNLALICRHLLCIATVSLKNHSQHDFRSFEKRIRELPEVIECFTVSGEFDFFLKVLCPDMHRYLEINELLVGSNDYTVTISTHVVMNQNKHFDGFDIGSLYEVKDKK